MLSIRMGGLFYGWVVLGVSFLTMASVYTLRYSFSFFFVALLEDFPSWGRAATASILSVNVLVYGLALPVVGSLVDRLGPRRVMSLGVVLVGLGAVLLSRAQELWQFYLLFGLVMALGICLTGWVPNTTVLSRWFVRRRGLALGVASAGVGTTYVLASFTQVLISSLGWRQAYLVLGLVVALFLLPIIALFHRGRPQEMGLSADGQEDPSEADLQQGGTTLAQALRDRRFWLLFLASFFLWGIGMTLVLIHQIAFIKDIGFTPALGAQVYLVFGLMYLVGNLSGFVSDRLGREMTLTLGILGVALGVGMLILAGLRPHPAPLFLFSIFFGLGGGLCSPTLTAAVADLFQGRHFGAINGFITMGFGLGGAFSPWLGGYLFDRLHSYLLAFAIALLAILSAGALVRMAAPRQGAARGRRPAGSRSL